MRELLLGGTLLASFVAGVVALFAPCCISVMLPAYFASSFRRRRALIGMTALFAAGLATVILPIALGATGISRLVFGHHRLVFITGAVVMLVMGVATLTGRGISLPGLAPSGSPRRGARGVFLLGVFSGTASACCAPVLAGVVALSGAANSFVVALAVGAAYVFGMVAPLFVLAVLWDRRDWANGALMRGKTVGVFGRPVQIAALVSGVTLIAMAALTAVLAVRGPSMANTGWQAHLTAQLNHYAANVTHATASVPGWVVLTLLIAAAIGLFSAASTKQHAAGAPPLDAPADNERTHT